MDKEIVNWGIISCARIADRAVIPGILGAKNAVLYAVAGKNQARLCEFAQKYHPAKTYNSYDALLDDPGVDAVYIPLPNGLHKEWVIKAAQKKKHVLCEKPLGISAQEVEQMKQVCDENGVLLMEAFAYLHSPLTKAVAQLVESGAIGKIRFIQSQFSYFLNERDDVRLQKGLAGGATYDIGCYNISIIRQLLGEPASLYATGTVSADNVDESSCIQMLFDNGATAVSHCSLNCAEWIEYTVVGESGAIDVPVPFNRQGSVKICITKGSGREELCIDCPDNYMLEVEQFGRCILAGEQPLVTHAFSLGNARVIDDALRQVLRP